MRSVLIPTRSFPGDMMVQASHLKQTSSAWCSCRWIDRLKLEFAHCGAKTRLISNHRAFACMARHWLWWAVIRPILPYRSSDKQIGCWASSNVWLDSEIKIICPDSAMSKRSRGRGVLLLLLSSTTQPIQALSRHGSTGWSILRKLFWRHERIATYWEQRRESMEQVFTMSTLYL